jgi:hypothetical protein
MVGLAKNDVLFLVYRVLIFLWYLGGVWGYDMYRYYEGKAIGEKGVCISGVTDSGFYPDWASFQGGSRLTMLPYGSNVGRAPFTVIVVNCIRYWPFFLTHWTLIAVVLYLGFAAVCSLQAIRYLRKDTLPPKAPNAPGRVVPWTVYMTSVLQGIALPTSLTVLVLYWALVFDPDGAPPSEEDPDGEKASDVGYMNLAKHCTHFIVVFLDVALSSQPVYVAHSLYAAVFMTCYALWTVALYFFKWGDGYGNNYLYKSLDWSNPGISAGVLSINLFITLPLLSLLIFALVYLIRWLSCGEYRTMEYLGMTMI